MNHTETPWQVRSTRAKSSFTTHWNEIYAGNRPVVSAASYDHSSALGSETICGVCINPDDANFIVCACNCHDDLFNACTALLREIQADPAAAAYFDLRHIKAAEDAIAKVKAQGG